MRRIIALLLTAVLCMSLSACRKKLSPSDTITYNEDYSQMYYNGHTYIDSENTNGKYRMSFEEEGWHEIATMPWSRFMYALVGEVTVYYGNETDNPAVITADKTSNLYIREDILLDHDSQLCLYNIEQEYDFTISEVTTGNVIAYDYEQKNQFTEICNFFVAFKEYPTVRLWLTILEREGSFYLQDVYNSDYYEITEEFQEVIYSLGLDALDYTARSPVS